MNSKAIRKQLLAAVAMVLVAAVALGSSTYAWFVASGTVEAKGMSVKAQSEGNLVIRHTTKMWATVADAGMTGAAPLSPASTADLANWVHASALNPGNYAADGKYNDITNTVTPSADDGGNNNGYVIVKQFFIRSATKENTPNGLFIDSIDISGTPVQGMSSALRVGVKCTYKTNTSTKIYAPISTVTNPAKYGTVTVNSNSVEGVHLKDGTAKAVTLSKTGRTDPLLSGEVQLPGPADGDSDSTTAVEVMVYIWFEGEDINLYSDNFATEDIDVSIKFQSLTAATAADSRDLTSASAVEAGKQTFNDVDYYPISGKTLNGSQLYAKEAGKITSASRIYTLTIVDGTVTGVSDVTASCTLPAASGS